MIGDWLVSDPGLRPPFRALPKALPILVRMDHLPPPPLPPKEWRPVEPSYKQPRPPSHPPPERMLVAAKRARPNTCPDADSAASSAASSAAAPAAAPAVESKEAVPAVESKESKESVDDVNYTARQVLRIVAKHTDPMVVSLGGLILKQQELLNGYQQRTGWG